MARIHHCFDEFSRQCPETLTDAPTLLSPSDFVGRDNYELAHGTIKSPSTVHGIGPMPQCNSVKENPRIHKHTTRCSVFIIFIQQTQYNWPWRAQNNGAYSLSGISTWYPLSSQAPVFWFTTLTPEQNGCHFGRQHIEGILPKGPYLPCVSMVGRALLAGYHRYRRLGARLQLLQCISNGVTAVLY